MEEIITQNTGLLSAVVVLVADVVLTRLNKVKYKGMILRVLSALGKVAQSQVEKGTKK